MYVLIVFVHMYEKNQAWLLHSWNWGIEGIGTRSKTQGELGVIS